MILDYGKRLSLESKKKTTCPQPSPGSTMGHLQPLSCTAVCLLGSRSLSSLLEGRWQVGGQSCVALGLWPHPGSLFYFRLSPPTLAAAG